MKSKRHLCGCGNPKPYRRAYACSTCWLKLGESFWAALIGRQGKFRSLRLK